MIQNKKQMYIVIGAFILVLALFTTTYAFFNYTRTGSANVIKTGRISFNSTQGNTINLTNMFPIAANETNLADSTKVGTVTINVTGDTTYTEGIEYLVTATNVQNTVGNKSLPISIDVSYSANTNKTIGSEDEEYFDNRGGNSSLYRILAKDTITNNGKLVVGYIKPDQTGIDGNIVIKAYIDKAKVAISDTYPEEETDTNNDGYLDGTPNSFGTGRTIFTTTEWNSLQQNGVSFQIKVEANEGIWVEEDLTINAATAIPAALKEGITEIYFNKMGRTRMQQAYDAATVKADMTANNEGKVLAWQEGNKLYIVSDGETYLPEYSGGYFYNIIGITNIEFNNINTSRVTDMTAMFNKLSNLTNIDLRSFDTSNVTSMTAMFGGDSSLVSIDLSYLNTDRVTRFDSMFLNCSNLVSANISGFGNDNVSNLDDLFEGCTVLKNVNMQGFNFGHATLLELFKGLTSLETINLNNANASNVTNMNSMFYNCSSLVSVDLSTISTPNVTNMGSLFSNCTNLTSVNLSGLGGNNLSIIGNMFGNCTNLREINMSGFNFGTTHLAGFFSNMQSLYSVDLSGITYNNNMAYNLVADSSVQIVDLSNANINSLTDATALFYHASQLKTIYVSNTWSNNHFTNSTEMFNGCTSLEGGNGTHYDESYPKDKTYAIIDGTNGQPGYFTLKTN